MCTTFVENTKFIIIYSSRSVINPRCAKSSNPGLSNNPSGRICVCDIQVCNKHTYVHQIIRIHPIMHRHLIPSHQPWLWLVWWQHVLVLHIQVVHTALHLPPHTHACHWQQAAAAAVAALAPGGPPSVGGGSPPPWTPAHQVQLQPQQRFCRTAPCPAAPCMPPKLVGVAGVVVLVVVRVPVCLYCQGSPGVVVWRPCVCLCPPGQSQVLVPVCSDDVMMVVLKQETCDGIKKHVGSKHILCHYTHSHHTCATMGRPPMSFPPPRPLPRYPPPPPTDPPFPTRPARYRPPSSSSPPALEPGFSCC